MRPEAKRGGNAVTSVTAILFCAFLAVLFVLFWALPDKDFSATEKRVLSSFPKAAFARIADGSFEADLEKYVQDQMPGRNLWVGLCAYFNAAAGQNGVDGAYVCGEDYLINTPVKDDFRNLGSNLKYLGRFAGSTGLPMTLMPVPQTGYILTELLPPRHAPYTDDAVYAQIEENLPDGVSLLDLRGSLRAQARTEQVFYKTDHHWTSAGAFTAANAFLTASGRPALRRADFEPETIPGFYGTIYSKLALWGKPSDEMQLWHMPSASCGVTVRDLGKSEVKESKDVFFRDHLTEYDMYPVYLDGNHSFTRIVNDAAPEGTLLLLKDSFGNTLATELAAAYREILMVDMRYYRSEKVSDLAAQYGAEAVLACYSVDSLMHDTNILWLK